MWVYVVLHADIHKLATMISFLKNYSNPNLAFSEAGYYLSSLEFAAEYVRTLTFKDLLDNPLQYDEKWLVCEQDRYLQLSQSSDCPFVICSQSETLTGFDLYAVTEWINDCSR